MNLILPVAGVARAFRRWSAGLRAAACGVLAWPALPAADERGPHDLVVYGGTPGGISCAVRAAREGLNVLLVSHREQLGGMLSDGLSVWDAVYAGFRAPLYEELRQAFWDYYRTTYGENSPEYKVSLPGHAKGRYEARVAATLTARMVAREPRIRLVTGYHPVAAERAGRVLRTVTFRELDGVKMLQATAAIFADCSYEGDLMAVAKVPSRLGREARTEYGEPHAGRIFMRAGAWPPPAANPAELADYRRLKLVHYRRWQEIVWPESTGAADSFIQAFNFRVVLSSDLANQWKPTKPADYDPAKLAGLSARGAHGPLPNRKALWNHPELHDGFPNAYIEGDWPTRQRLVAEARKTTLALLYYLQNDPAVPPATREAWAPYGIAKDEFVDNGNMPRELYVREARRLMGRATFTELDVMLAAGVQRAPLPGDSNAITDWVLDVHACRSERVGGSLEEGTMLLNNQTWPAQVSYRTLLPRDVDNLLVPVCLSASHVGWGAVRLEPTWMHIGESAGYAAALAVRGQKTPADIDPDELLQQLARRRVMLTFFDDADIASGAAWEPGVQYLGAKGFLPTYWARPAEKLTGALAKRWIAAAGELAERTAIDPTARARSLMAWDRVEGDPITVAEFARQLAAGLPAGRGGLKSVEQATARAGLAKGKVITRGEACALIFAELAPAETVATMKP